MSWMLSVIFLEATKKPQQDRACCGLSFIQVIGAHAARMQLHTFGAASTALGFRLFLDRRDAFFAIFQKT